MVTLAHAAAVAAQPVPDDPFKLPEIPLWNHTGSVRGGFGFKDNVTLSSLSVQESAFLLTGAEFTLWRMPVNGLEFLVLLSGDDTRYFSGDVDKEQTGIAVAQLKKTFNDRWQAGLLGQYIYQDQVLDSSTVEQGVGSTRVQGHSYGVRPSVRHDWQRRWWSEVELNLNRQEFAGALDSYWEGGCKLTLGRSYGHKSDVSFHWLSNRRDYDSREQLDVTGAAIPGEALVFTQHKFQWQWRHHFDEKRHWLSTSRFGYELNQGNGSGYFDFHKYSFSQQVRYRAEPWEIRGQIRFAHFDYPIQPASATDPTPRARDEMTFNLRLERALGRAFRLFTELEHERSRSNQAVEQYQVNTVSAGVIWEF